MVDIFEQEYDYDNVADYRKELLASEAYKNLFKDKESTTLVLTSDQGTFICSECGNTMTLDDEYIWWTCDHCKKECKLTVRGKLV